MKRWLLIVTVCAAGATSAFAQRTDLSGLTFCIDPGHGGYESDDRHVIPDPGTDFWESESNFQKALWLKPLLEARGATVYLTRSGNSDPDLDDPSLSARWQFANSVNADWFHSIHSNATGWSVNTTVNYTMVLIKENISTRQPAFPLAVTMSGYVYNHIRAELRTTSSGGNIAAGVYLDYTFYGGPNGGYNLGVLSGLAMPGQLSEGSFHDNYAETRRLMNNSYRKMEAYALRDAFMQYFGVPADTLCIVGGIQSKRGFSTPVDQSMVRLLPEDRVYTGDSYHNGFYMFDSLTAGAHTVVFETPGYINDSVAVNVAAGTTTFLDRGLEPAPPPKVVSSTPVQNDTSFKANLNINIQFSKIMDTASVRAAFSISPPVNGKLQWSGNNTYLTFAPDSVVLPFDQAYTITIDTTARSERGMYLDGNGDGISGDPFVLSFKTEPVDAWPPVITATYPAPGQTIATSNQVINITFDEPLNPATVNTTNIVIRVVGGLILPRTVQYWEANGKGGVNLYVTNGLSPGLTYQIRVSDVADVAGNAIPGTSSLLWEFSTSPDSYIYTSIDNFNGDPTVNWWQPSGSGSTTGISSAVLAGDTARKFSFIPTSTASAKLSFTWDTTQASWLIREYLNAGAPRSVTWNKRMGILQAYVWGDGSHTLFRFAVDDSVDAFPGGTGTNHEVSQWIPVDWVGWRLVEWDLENDPVGTWLGNGILEGLMRFDSFQLTYQPDSSTVSGVLNLDELQIAKNSLTPVEETASGMPDKFDLLQNFPNPFNPETRIAFNLPSSSRVTLLIIDLLGRRVRTLVSTQQPAGRYTVTWDGRDDAGTAVASGVYIYQLQADNLVMTKKMMLIR